MFRHRHLRLADLAPVIVLADDQAIEQALVENFSAVGNSAARLLVTSTARRYRSAYAITRAPIQRDKCTTRAPALNAPKKLTG